MRSQFSTKVLDREVAVRLSLCQIQYMNDCRQRDVVPTPGEESQKIVTIGIKISSDHPEI
jgi:hypothetical protein